VLSKLSGEVVETQRDLTNLVETLGCFSYLSWQFSMKCVAAPSAFVSAIHISCSALLAFGCCEPGEKAVLELLVTQRVNLGGSMDFGRFLSEICVRPIWLKRLKRKSRGY
jgi:hypothetical protein